ncbi:hypothetical protein [Sphingobacterium sp.]|uniref:hypothetical protein n=1 Tax=Sphingobacterium sp. TaxID=341027 RepID=UPI0031CFFC68
MKLFSVFLFLLILQSCTIQNIGTKEKNSLYINTSIPARTSLAISTEDASQYSIEATEKSNSSLKLQTETQNIKMEKNKKYNLNIAEKESINIINQSDQLAKIQLRVFNHSSKIIQKTDQIK